MKRLVRLLNNIAVLVGLALVAIPSLSRAAAMGDYCIVPPFLSQGNTPNLLLMLDNSASMYDLKYTGTDFCHDNTYDNHKYCSVTTTQTCTSDAGCPFVAGSTTVHESCNSPYVGYFDQDTYYQSNGISYATDTTASNNQFPPFTVVGSLPSTCTFGTSYLCAQMDDLSAPTTVTFTAKGSFLNWLSMSKLDVEKKVLTGGKYVVNVCSTTNTPCATSSDCASGTCGAATSTFMQGETRGCVGSSYVKEVPAGDWTTVLPILNSVTQQLTFGVRGDISQDVRLPSQGGVARIDLYVGKAFDNASCQAAVTAWTTGSGSGQNSTNSATSLCLNTTATQSTPRTIWNHSLQTCWSCGSPCTPDKIQNGDVQRLEGNSECGSLTSGVMGTLTPTLPTYVCLSDSNKPNPTFPHSSLYDPYNTLSFKPNGGYVGVCVTSWNSDMTPKTWDDTCVAYQLASYCNGLQVGEVVDPTSGLQATGNFANIPSSMIDGGLAGQLGAPKRTFPVRVATGTPPTGLLQKYQNQVRFGAMAFNKYGSTSECTSTNTMILSTCTYSDNQDAGKIIAYIGGPGRCSANSAITCSSNSDCVGNGVCNSAGDHTGGLINAVDAVVANTWTPLAEAYYNAISYFVKDATGTNSVLDSTKFTPDSNAIKTPIPSTDATLATSGLNKNPIQYRCQSNNILLVTDGGSTTDVNGTMTTKVRDSSGYFRDPATLTESGSTSTTVSGNTVDACGTFLGSPYLHDLSYFARHRNIFHPVTACYDASGNFLSPMGCSGSGATCTMDSQCPSGQTCTRKCENSQSISTYAVYTGSPAGATTSLCDSQYQVQKTAGNGGGTFSSATNFQQLYTALDQALAKISAQTSSGTAASILSNSEGTGANILQAVFYPEKVFDSNTKTSWIGEMQNLWYYLDPFLSRSTVREDSVTDKQLNLTNDYIVTFRFDQSQNPPAVVVDKTKDVNGDGSQYVSTGYPGLGTGLSPDSVKSLWRAGNQLWSKSASSRHIYTPLLSGGSETTSNSGLMSFSGDCSTSDNCAALRSYLQAAPSPSTEAQDIISYVRGNDVAINGNSTRSRTVQTTDFLTGVSGSHVWKLGDIISSTPRLESSNQLNSYSLDPPSGYSDGTYTSFSTSSSYASRGVAFVGANDGMLHAFRLGLLDVIPSGTTKATLANSGTSTGTTPNLGDELWAFIPTNALPYLRYTADSSYMNNNHLYFVDGPTVLVDASVGTPSGCTGDYWSCDRAASTWRTILIGGMGIGGASRVYNETNCTDKIDTGTCVKSPITGAGLSSYFALDVTDPTSPVMKWELSASELGFATSGPAIVRVKATQGNGDDKKNGRWYAVFGSGPTGPISNYRFLGKSDQHLKLFVVDLATGTYWVIDTGIANAFAGSLIGASIDTDRWSKNLPGNYQDDALYFGYTRANTNPNAIDSSTTWTSGGVLRVVIPENFDPTTGNPATDWHVSTVIDGIGPVTSAVVKLQDRMNYNLWLYFGTGRYYYGQDDVYGIDPTGYRTLYGVKELCYKGAGTSFVNDIDYTDTSFTGCSAALSTGSLTNKTTDYSDSLALTGPNGWYINLSGVDTTNKLNAERLVTDPVALSNGVVYFTTFKPTADVCNFGGSSFLWGVKYSTGAAPPTAALQGKALIQLSTGSFEQKDLSTVLVDSGGRKSTAMTGKPPGDPPPIVSKSGNKPVKRIIHIQEH